MDITDWRRKIDEIDRQLVDLISRRAQAAHEIGKLKRSGGLPIYEPDRERAVLEHVIGLNKGPLPSTDLKRIFERIMDVMRQIQVEEIAPETIASDGHAAIPGDTEIDTEVND